MADVVLWQSIRVAACVLVLFYVITVEEIENREEQKNVWTKSPEIPSLLHAPR